MPYTASQFHDRNDERPKASYIQPGMDVQPERREGSTEINVY